MKFRVLSLALALLLALGGCSKNQDATEDAPAAPVGTPVETRTVETGDMATENTFSGQVVADKAVYVVPMAQGVVSGLDVEAGDTVTQGELLFRIDTSTVTAGYGALSDSYAATKEMTDQAIKNAEIGIENARMALQNAQNNLYNTQQLFAIGAASQLELDGAQDAAVQAQYGLEQAENALVQAQASQTSSLAQIQSSMSSMGAQAANGRVTAPCSGLVTAVSVVNGGVAGGSAAMTIAEDGRTRVSVSVSESIYGQLHIGDTAQITIPAFSAEPYTAMIASMDIAANPQTALYEIKLYTPDGAACPIGSFAEITFFTDRRENVVRIPTEAILTDGENRYVYTIENNTASRVAITTGLAGVSETEVTSGLSGGETLVVKGQSYLEDGAAVRIISEG